MLWEKTLLMDKSCAQKNLESSDPPVNPNKQWFPWLQRGTEFGPSTGVLAWFMSSLSKDVAMAMAQKPAPKWNPGKWKHGPTPA